MKKTVFLAAATGLVALAGLNVWPVLAADDNRGAAGSNPAIGEAASTGAWLSETAVEQKLAGFGYTVREIEREDDVYEVEVTDANGLHLEAYVDPLSGDIVADDD